MFNQIFQILLEIIFNLFGMSLVFRTWLNSINISPELNSLSSKIYKCTDWLVKPLYKGNNEQENFDWSTLLISWFVSLIFLIIKWLFIFGATIATNSIIFITVTATIILFRWTLNLIMWLLVIHAFLSWKNSRPDLTMIVQIMLNPVLNVIRKFLPRINNIDFSSFFLLILVQILSSFSNQIIINLLRSM